MSWFEKLMPSRIRTDAGHKRAVPEGLWTKCPGCSAILYRAEMERNLDVCPKCNHHNRIGARRRLETFLDPEPQEEIGAGLESVDPLKFKDSKKYKERLSQAMKASGEKDALVAMRGQVKGMDVVAAAAFEFAFMGGSMGSVVGERFVQGAHTALEERIPLVCFSASGGARMQESLFSLMQMAKTSAALERLQKRGLFISVLTNPTMGGVAASFAALGDVVFAEPNALIGFAGPRVIEQTVREKLPEGFQRSEFLLEHGAIDMIIDRRDMRDRIADLLSIFMDRARP